MDAKRIEQNDATPVLPPLEIAPLLGPYLGVAVTGAIMTMPGLPRVPSANSIYLNEQGQIEGVF